MKYIKEKTIHQIEINKSLFIALVYPLNNQGEIPTLLEDAKQSYPKANHYCSASIFGEKMEHVTASDDGEPSRTAGIPILEVLKHHDISNILCVIVRYFGGIKLGSGGLVRAYTKATSEALKRVKLYYKKQVPSYTIEFEYSLINHMDHYFENKANIIDKSFLSTVKYKIVLLDDNPSFIDDISHQLISHQELEREILWIKI
ncbi:MAG: YigZ family protein [Acholeplasmataceae bacterium]|nr:YigZ family protein [Acholeplasmataceae bacterium]